MSTLKYESSQEAEMRLSGTIVAVDGEPYKVEGCQYCYDNTGKQTRDIELLMRKVPTQIAENDPIFKYLLKDPAVRVKGMKLGYTPYNNGTAVYLSRQPTRKYKQGLSHNNLAVCTRGVVRPMESRMWSELVGRQKGLITNFTGNFDGFDKLCELVEKNKGRQDPGITILNRKFAARHSPSGIVILQHKGEEVGYAALDAVKKGFTFAPHFKYLKEVAEESNVRIA